MLDNLKREIKEYYYKLQDVQRLKQMIGNFGKVVVEDDKIVCYVDGNELIRKGMFSLKFDVTSMLGNGINFDKSIYYVFDRIVFPMRIRLESNSVGSNINVIFKNCVFNKAVFASSLENVIFENNKYCSFEFFFVNEVKNLRFINDNCVDSSKYEQEVVDKKATINFNVYENVEMFNSHININKYQYNEFEINAKNLIMESSSISAKEIYLKANRIDLDNDSKIIAPNIVGVLCANDNLDLEKVETRFFMHNREIYEESNKKLN